MEAFSSSEADTEMLLRSRLVVTRAFATGLVTEPGDTNSVPEGHKTAIWVQEATDRSQINHPLGNRIAGIKSAVN